MSPPYSVIIAEFDAQHDELTLTDPVMFYTYREAEDYAISTIKKNKEAMIKEYDEEYVEANLFYEYRIYTGESGFMVQ